MNDIRNLMDNLHAQIDYKEFGGGVRPPTGAWPILQRVGRMTPPPPPKEPPAAEVEAEPVQRAPRASLVRGLRRPKRSLLTGYAAPETAGDDARRLPLAEVFAKLADGG